MLCEDSSAVWIIVSGVTIRSRKSKETVEFLREGKSQNSNSPKKTPCASCDWGTKLADWLSPSSLLLEETPENFQSKKRKQKVNKCSLFVRFLSF